MSGDNANTGQAGDEDRRPSEPPAGQARRTIEIIPASRLSPFDIACMAILYGGTLLLFCPYLPGEYRWGAVAMVLCMAAIPLVFPLFLNRRRTVDLDEVGIHTKSRAIAWESISAIRMGWPRRFGAAIAYGEPRRKLRLPLSMPFLRELLPELLLRRRPDLEVPPWLRRAMENPEAALAPSRWAIVPLGLTALLLVLFPVLARCAGSFWLLASPMLAFIFLVIPSVLLMGSSQSDEKELLHVSHGPLALFIGVLGLTLEMGIPIFAIDAWVTLIAVMYIAGAFSAAFRLKLDIYAKAGILVLAIAAPMAIYWPQAGEYSPGRDITDLLGTGLHGGGLLWSRDGNWAVETMADGEKGETQCAVDMRNLRSFVLPLPKGYQVAWDLDGSCVVRTIGKGGRKTLYLYRIQEGREIKLSVSETPGGIRGRCISPSGGLVCWMESPDPNSPRRELRVYDFRSDKTQDLAVHWPDGNEIAWSACGWADDRTIAVQGWSPRWDCNAPSTPTQLHVLMVRYPGASAECLSSKSKFVDWRVSPDSLQAFAAGAGAGGADGNAYYVDLAGGREVMLGGEGLPAWQRDGRAAFRTRDFGADGCWVCKFDTVEAKESRLYRLPAGTTLASLSPHGRFAIIVHEGFRLYPAFLVDVKTGRQRRLNLPWLSAMFLRDIHGPDIWAPDEERYVESSFDMTRKSLRAVLKTVPDDWRGK
jgi:hypothetical protein